MPTASLLSVRVVCAIELHVPSFPSTSMTSELSISFLLRFLCCLKRNTTSFTYCEINRKNPIAPPPPFFLSLDHVLRIHSSSSENQE